MEDFNRTNESRNLEPKNLEDISSRNQANDLAVAESTVKETGFNELNDHNKLQVNMTIKEEQNHMNLLGMKS